MHYNSPLMQHKYLRPLNEMHKSYFVKILKSGETKKKEYHFRFMQAAALFPYNTADLGDLSKALLYKPIAVVYCLCWKAALACSLSCSASGVGGIPVSTVGSSGA